MPTGAIAQQRGESSPQPMRLNDLLGPSQWIQLSGRQRTRFESLHGQFRADPASGSRPDNEDQWFLRTSLRCDVTFERLGGTVELLDSRAYGGSNRSQTNTGFVNTTDVLQGYVTADLGELGRGQHRLLAGRWTMNLGSRRFVIRNGYRNTINSFTGVDWLWRNKDGEQLRAFWSMPTRRRPADAPSLRDNEFEWDDQDVDLQFFGVFGTRRLDRSTTLELYAFGVNEDADDAPLRRVYTPGVRYVRQTTDDGWFAEVEGAFQFGQSQLRVNGPTLDHSAYFLHGSVGYRFDTQWQPTVRVAYDHGSGDRDPTDTDNNRVDRLFGAPRFEYGPTGLWSAIQRSNFTSPELRVSVTPTTNTWVMLAYRDWRLAAPRDQLVGSGVVDPSGAAGDHVGHHLELRARWDAVPNNMHIEIGGAYLFAGSFLDRAPNSRGGGDSRYGYVEMIWVL